MLRCSFISQVLQKATSSYGTALCVLQTHLICDTPLWSDSGKHGISSKSKQATFWRQKEESGGGGGGSGGIAAPVKWG